MVLSLQFGRRKLLAANCSPNSFSAGNDEWQTLQVRPYWRANIGAAPAGGATLAAAMASTTDGKRSRFIGASLLEGPLRRVPRCGDVIVSALPARPSTALRPVV